MRENDYMDENKPEFAREKPREEVEQVLEEYLKEEYFGGKKKTKRKLWSRLRNMGRKKKLIAAGCGAVLLFLISRAACGGNAAKPLVSTEPLRRGDVTAVLTLTGPVSGTDSADVVSNLHAEVREILVREGDKVKKGQILARVDSADVQKEVDIAQNSYDLAVSEYEENIRDTQNRYEKAVQDYDAAKLNYDRNQVLFQAGDISSAQMEEITDNLKDAARQVESFTVAGGKAVPDKSFELKVRSAQFELEKKKSDLENAEVKSPIDGTVTRVNSKVGQFADKPEDEKPMFVIENLEKLEMEIAVSEYSVGKIKTGQRAEITADILNGKTVEGEITSISPTGEEKGGGSTERVVPTTIQVEGGSASGLMAGITARASIVTGKAENTFVVPQTALIQQEDGRTAVAVADPSTGIIHMVPVITGVESDLTVEVFPAKEGALEEGMRIVGAPDGLSDGMAVVLN